MGFVRLDFVQEILCEGFCVRGALVFGCLDCAVFGALGDVLLDLV